MDSQSINVLIASDSYKGSATSRKVNYLIEQGVRRVCPDARVQKFSIADGGEGTLDALVSGRRGEIHCVRVHGPLGQEVAARYGIVRGTTAVVEMAEASGITLMQRNAANALAASTRGVGELILDALDQGVTRVCVGLGGSATSDGGTGMARALGVRFLDSTGREVEEGLRGLASLASIDVSGLDPRVKNVDFVALTDVSNTLAGPHGAVRMYGPQKGIAPEDLDRADTWMASYGNLLVTDVHSSAAYVSGSGAAGGLGAGLIAFCGARVVSGVDYVLDAIGIEQAMAEAQLVITGEGRMDAQSAYGKAPIGVARRAKRHGLPVIAVVGSRADDLGDVYREGIDLVLPTITAPATLEECIARVDTNIPLAGETAMQAFLLGSRSVNGK